MLIIESLADGKRFPAYARDKVMSLGDIAIYTLEEDVPLAEVLEKLKARTDGRPVQAADIDSTDKLRDFFGTVLENFDRERVHDSDIRKLIAWYNLLIGAGITEFVEKPKAEAEEAKEENA